MIFEKYRKEKISNLESSTHYLRSIGAGIWFVSQPEINVSEIEIIDKHDSDISQKMGCLLQSIDHKITDLCKKYRKKIIKKKQRLKLSK